MSFRTEKNGEIADGGQALDSAPIKPKAPTNSLIGASVNYLIGALRRFLPGSWGGTVRRKRESRVVLRECAEVIEFMGIIGLMSRGSRPAFFRSGGTLTVQRARGGAAPRVVGSQYFDFIAG